MDRHSVGAREENGNLALPVSLQFSCSAFWVILIYWFYWPACKEGKPVLRKNQAIWTCVCIVSLIDCAVDSYRSTKDTLNIFEQTMCVRIVMNRTSMVPACLVCLLITLTLTGQVFSWTHILYILYHFMIFVTIYTYMWSKYHLRMTINKEDMEEVECNICN